MSNYTDIALRISHIIASPESATGFVDGVLSVPVDLGYMAYGIFDTDTAHQRQTDRIRMAAAVKRGILNHEHIYNMIKIVFDLFSDFTGHAKQDAIYSKVSGSIIGRTVTNSIISGKIAATIAEQMTVFVKIRGALTGNILLIGGMAERSIRTSKALSIESPEVYGSLRPRDYDLLYFLVESVLSPFIQALNVREKHGQSQFEEILRLVEMNLEKSSFK